VEELRVEELRVEGWGLACDVAEPVFVRGMGYEGHRFGFIEREQSPAASHPMTPRLLGFRLDPKIR
jgi:hypothetical protein